MDCPKCGGILIEADDEHYLCKNCGAYFRRKKVAPSEKAKPVIQKSPERRMYKNIGGKIKTLTAVITCIIIFASFIAGIVALSEAKTLYNELEKNLPFSEGFKIVLIYFIVIPFLAWIGSFFEYGFGELIERTKRTNENTEQIIKILSEIRESKQNKD